MARSLAEQGRDQLSPAGVRPGARLASTGARALLLDRAESYARDARRFRAGTESGTWILSRTEDAYWGSIYSTIADELRKVAAQIT